MVMPYKLFIDGLDWKNKLEEQKIKLMKEKQAENK